MVVLGVLTCGLFPLVRWLRFKYGTRRS